MIMEIARLDRKTVTIHFQFTSPQKLFFFLPFAGFFRSFFVSESPVNSGAFRGTLSKKVSSVIIKSGDGSKISKPCDIRSSRISPHPTRRYRIGGFPL